MGVNSEIFQMKKVKFLLCVCLLTIAVSCGQQKRYISYKVKQGETIRDIAKRLNMKTKDLLRLNPDVSRRPEVNTVIIIPSVKNKNGQIIKDKEDKEVKTETVDVEPIQTTPIVNQEELEELKKNFIVHIAKPKETMYGLKRFYNVSIDSIYALNPGLKENGLKIGQFVKIKSIITEKDKQEAEEVTEMYQDIIATNKVINVAFLLPFRAKSYDSVVPVDIFKGKGSRLPNMVTDFYLGSEIAIDSLRKQGINIKVKVFDTGNKGENITKILINNNLNDVDVILGPFYSDKAEMIARSVKVPVVFPHYSKKQAQFTSTKLIKTTPDKSVHTSYLITYLKENYNGETIFIVGDGKSKSNGQVNAIVAGLQNHDSIQHINVIKPEEGYIKKERFTDKMKPKKHCWVLMTTEDNVVVEDVLNSIVVLPEEVTAQMILVDKNEAYDKIDNNKLARVNLTYVTNVFIDETAEEVKSFLKKYEKKNYAPPLNYAIKGFDITYDTLIRLASGEDLTETFKKGTSLRIENKFDYNKKIFGTTSNNGLFIVKYNQDLSLTRLD